MYISIFMFLYVIKYLHIKINRKIKFVGNVFTVGGEPGS